MKNDMLYLQFPDNINSGLHHTVEGNELRQGFFEEVFH